MSGHSKWAQIRRSKGVNDARRGQLFTRLGREIVVAVREGGSGDPNANFRLRMAIQRARDANMPMDNIERRIKRETIRQTLESKKYKIVKAESTLLPKTRVELADEKIAHQVMRLVEKFEDLDDVQNVYTNADFPEAFAASYEG